MMLKILEWDSDFFGIKTASLQANLESSDLEKLRKEIADYQVKLIYVFESKDSLSGIETLSKLFPNTQLVDRKVTYTKSVQNTKGTSKLTVKEYHGVMSDGLLELAYAAGKYSRFFVDKQMPSGKGKELYKLWIQKSISGEIADKVYVTEENGIITGFISVKNKQDSVSIGLVAVDENIRGQGIGKALIEKTEEFTRDNKIIKLSVVTQLDNVRACKFYESCGFQVEKVENIYHIWL